MQMETTVPCHLQGWLERERQATLRVRGDGATKNSRTTGGSVNRYNHAGNWLAVSTEAEHVYTLQPQVYAKQKYTHVYPKEHVLKCSWQHHL